LTERHLPGRANSKPKRMRSAKTIVVALSALCAAACSEGSVNLPDEVFHVIAHSTSTDEYVIIFRRTEGQRRIVTEIVGPCAYYQWGRQPPLRGHGHCNLSVGAEYRPNPQSARTPSDERIEAILSPAILILRKGEGADRSTNAIAVQSQTFVRAESVGES
jgi:hypothetical protein